MSSERIIVDAIKVAQNLLDQSLTPAHKLTDAPTVLRFRELARSQAIRSALERSSDTLFAFALRAVERVTSDHSQTNRETINRLWEVLDSSNVVRRLTCETIVQAVCSTHSASASARDFRLRGVGRSVPPAGFVSTAARLNAFVSSTSGSDKAAAVRARWARFLSIPASASVGGSEGSKTGFSENPVFAGRPP